MSVTQPIISKCTVFGFTLSFDVMSVNVCVLVADIRRKPVEGWAGPFLTAPLCLHFHTFLSHYKRWESNTHTKDSELEERRGEEILKAHGAFCHAEKTLTWSSFKSFQSLTHCLRICRWYCPFLQQSAGWCRTSDETSHQPSVVCI